LVALIVARRHVGDFWAGRTKVPLPGVGDFNEAIIKTQVVRLNMLYLAVLWIFSGGFYFLL